MGIPPSSMHLLHVMERLVPRDNDIVVMPPRAPCLRGVLAWSAQAQACAAQTLLSNRARGFMVLSSRLSL